MNPYVQYLEIGKRYRVFFDEEECSTTALCYGNTGERHLLRDDDDGLEWSVPVHRAGLLFEPEFIPTDTIVIPEQE